MGLRSIDDKGVTAMVSEKAHNARMANLEKAHEKIRREGQTEKQSRASRQNLEKAHEKVRREGPTDKQREAGRQNITKAHRSTHRNITEEQREARRAWAKELWKTRGSPRPREAREYALSFTDSLGDAIGFETNTVGDARLTARDIAMDEFSSVNRDALRRTLRADPSKFKDVNATVWAYDKGYWRMFGRVSVTFRSTYDPMAVVWYDPKRGKWCNINYSGAISPVKGD